MTVDCRIADFQNKEVINICDGRRIGYICDVEADLRTGRIAALVDSFSAMIMDRAYAKAKQPVQAGAELAKDARYDTMLAKKLLTPFATGKWELADMDAALEAASA